MIRKLNFTIICMAFAWAMLLAAGCAPLTSDVPPPAIYRLEPAPPTTAADVRFDDGTIIAVAPPRLPAGFSGRDIILVFDGGRRQDYFAGAAWAGNLDDLIQQFLINSMRETYPGLSVNTTQGGLNPGYILTVEVLDFQPEYQEAPEGQPRLHMRLNYVLQDAATRAVLADFTLERTATAENNLTAITAGLEQLLQDMTGDALGRIAEELQAS